MQENEQKIYCAKCGVCLENKTASFTYLDHRFQAQVLCCPICGRCFVPEELADGRMKEVESMLETK